MSQRIMCVETHDKEENLLHMILASPIRVNEELHSKQPTTLKFQFIHLKSNPAVTLSSISTCIISRIRYSTSNSQLKTSINLELRTYNRRCCSPVGFCRWRAPRRWRWGSGHSLGALAALYPVMLQYFSKEINLFSGKEYSKSWFSLMSPMLDDISFAS